MKKMEKNIIVLDCGATNVRAVVINEKGVIIAQKSFPNQTQEDPFHQGGIIWDDKEIWQKLVKATKSVVSQINPNSIIGITVTTFGVDGAPYDKDGQQLYPVISWACQREHDILDYLYAEISLSKLYKISGVNHFHFNTLYKLYWLLKNKPEIISKTDHWLFMPSIIAKNLTGTLYTDVSMLGTSMMGDMDTRSFSKEILDVLKMNKQQFPPLKRAGEQVGVLHVKASKELGIKVGTPVYAAGHDTQFAIFASGAKENEMILSSGTWEILMMRSSNISLNDDVQQKGVTVELDALNPLLNPGVQWLGSGILEWIKHTLFVDVKDRDDVYDIMIAEARAAEEDGLAFGIDFLNERGFIQGLDLKSTRGAIYLAALSALAEKTKENLKILEKLSGTKATSLIVVGGGSKNELWNEIRAEKLGISVNTNSQTETTVLGAAMFAFYGAGVYESAEEARGIFLANQ